MGSRESAIIGLLTSTLSSIVRLGVVAYRGPMPLDVVQTVSTVAARGFVAGALVGRCRTDADGFELITEAIISSLIAGASAAMMESFSIWVAVHVAG